MNRAVSIQGHIPPNRVVNAVNPDTGLWDIGYVTGTWAENRLDSPDFGFFIEFGWGIRTVSHRFIEC